MSEDVKQRLGEHCDNDKVEKSDFMKSLALTTNSIAASWIGF